MAFIRICKVCLRKYRCNNLTTMDNVGFTQICIHIYRTVNRCGNFYIFIQRKIGICLYGYLVIIGTPVTMLMDTVEYGAGNTLQGIVLLIGLGSMFGGILEVSGGAQQVAQTMIGKFGEKKAGLALGITGLVVGTTVFLKRVWSS